MDTARHPASTDRRPARAVLRLRRVDDDAELDALPPGADRIARARNRDETEFAVADFAKRALGAKRVRVDAHLVPQCDAPSEHLHLSLPANRDGLCTVHAWMPKRRVPTPERLVRVEAAIAEQLRRRDRFHHLADVALTDPVTGVADRRGIERVLEHLEPGDSVVVLRLGAAPFDEQDDPDVDDERLRRFARHLRTSLRRSDVIGRTSPREFLVVLPTTDLPVSIAARLVTSWHDLCPVHVASATAGDPVCLDEILALADDRLAATFAGEDAELVDARAFAHGDAPLVPIDA